MIAKIPYSNIYTKPIEKGEEKCLIQEYLKGLPKEYRGKPLLISCPCPKCSIRC